MANFYARYPAINVAAPVGGATAANQVLEINQLTQINSNTAGLTNIATETTLAALSAKVIVADTDNVTVIASALPTGAATEATLSSIDTKLTSPLAVTGPLTDTELRASPVDVAAASLPLPSGASTSALQTSGNASLTSIDSKLTSPLAVTGPLTDTQLRATPVPISGAVTTDGLTDAELRASPVIVDTQLVQSLTDAELRAAAVIVDTQLVQSLTDAQLRASAVPVSAAALPLPTGASTAANQVTAQASLTSIDSKLTSPLAVTGPLTDTELRASPVSISGAVTTDGLTDAELRASAVAISAATLPLPSGAATSANQVTAQASLTSIDNKLTAPLAVTGPLTDAQLRATPVPISGTVSTTGLTDTQLRAAPVIVDTQLVQGLTDTQLRASAVAISAAALPLPTGAATETTLSALNTKVTTTVNGIKVDGSAVTQPVSAASLPLPSGAATSANQTTANASLSSIDSKLTAPLAVTGPLTDTQLRATAVPVSGTVSTNGLTDAQLRASAVPVSATALPLPTGAATATNQTSGSQTTQVVNGANTLAIGAAGNVLVSGLSAVGAVPALNPVSVSGVDGGGLKRAILTDTSGAVRIDPTGTTTQPISAAALPLPSGASTSANQVTAQASLTSIDSKTPTVGQKTMANSSPVVISSDQSAIPITGSVTATNPSVSTTGSAIPASATMIGGSDGTNLRAAKVSAAGLLSVDGSAVTQPVSAAALPLPTGAATSANQTTAQASLTSIDSKLTSPLTVTGPLTDTQLRATPVPVSGTVSTGGLTDTQLRASAVPVSLTSTTITGSVAVTGPLTDTQLRATAVPVSGTVTANAGSGTFAISAASLPLPTGAATETTLAAINTKTPALGQAVSASSTPVVISSDQSAISVTTADLNVTGPASQTAVTNNILTGAGVTDLSGYRTAYVQVTSTGTAGTFIFEGSNDNTNFSAVPVYNQLILTGTPITAAITASVSQIIYTLPIQSRYMRLRIATTITGGSITATSRFSQQSWMPAIVQVAQNTAANLATTATIASGTVTTVSTVSAVTSVASSQTAIPGTIADVASAALTTTTTTAAFTPTFGSSYMVNIPVTAVTGTVPTLDVQIQESPDSGTNWFGVYDFPRITATGSYTSPLLPLTGNRVRYVQTVAGTTPSFTRAINRLQESTSVPVVRQIVDRTIAPITTNSTSAVLFAPGTSNYTMIVNQGAGGSAVTFALDGSDDNVNWVQSLATVAGVIGGATPTSVGYFSGSFKFIRARVVTGVASTTISSLSLIASALPGASSTITASTLPLPTGAATETTLAALNAKFNSLGQKTMANSAPVVLASDQASIPVSQAANTVGTYQEITNLTTTAQTFTAPANAVGFLLESDSANTNNLLYKIGATATTTSGMKLEPGRDTGYMPVKANISIIAAAGTNQIATVQWILTS